MNIHVKQALDSVLSEMPEERIHQVLDFARFIAARSEEEEWRLLGLARLATAYGPNEPDYSAADVKPELNS